MSDRNPNAVALNTAPSLHEIQAAFADGVFDRRVETPLSSVVHGKFSPARHFQVYQNNVFMSLADALRAVYPVVERLVGEEFFAFVARKFIRAFPPRGGNLHDFGDEFPGFLETIESAAQLAYLPDTARLEWAYHEAYHAAEGATFLPESLGALAPNRYETLRFTLQPHARLIASKYPVLRIWQVNQPGFDGDPSVDLTDGAAHVLILRHSREIELYALSKGEYVFLEHLAAQETFAQACEAALAAEAEFDLTEVLQRHVRRGTIENVR